MKKKLFVSVMAGILLVAISSFQVQAASLKSQPLDANIDGMFSNQTGQIVRSMIHQR